MRISKCPKCKQIKHLTRHHIDHNHNNNSKENILLICRDCHNYIHKRRLKHKTNKKYQKGTRFHKRKI